MKKATAGHQRLRRTFDVQQTATGGHPLGVAVADHSATAVRVGVLEGAIHDVGDGLEASVWMPRGALRLTRCVLDLTHLIHVYEGVEVAQVHSLEGPAYREAFSLESGRRGGH